MAAARIIDMSGVNPAPTNFTQPRTISLGGTTYYVQWVWFDVTLGDQPRKHPIPLPIAR